MVNCSNEFCSCPDYGSALHRSQRDELARRLHAEQNFNNIHFNKCLFISEFLVCILMIPG